MESFKMLWEDLHHCYSKNAKYSEDYLKLSMIERELLCKDEREKLIYHLNSDQMIFEHILYERLRWMKSKIKFNIEPLFPNFTERIHPESEWSTQSGEL